MTEVLLATYENIETANDVVNELVEAGFPHRDIGLAVHDSTGDYSRYLEDRTGTTGAKIGAVMGSLVGALTGLLAITVPGVGPVITGGILAALGGAAAGSGVGAATGLATGGLVSFLMDTFGVSEEEAGYYAETLRRGGALVAVKAKAADIDPDRAEKILQGHNPIDIDRRMHQWRQQGWEGFDPMVDPFTAAEINEMKKEEAQHENEATSGVRRYQG
jgi:hypothetical protein